MNEHDALTFTQRYGYEEIPHPLRLGELPKNVRVQIWNTLYVHLENTSEYSWDVGRLIGGPWRSILMRLYVRYDNKPLNKWNGAFDAWCIDLQQRFEGDSFQRVFKLIEFILRDRECPSKFILQIANLFRGFHLAYRIDFGPPPAIVQATTLEEGDELTGNLKALRTTGLHAASAHLRRASKCINDGDWAGSVRESIHAVESVAKKIDPGGGNTLGDVLKSLQRRGVLQHPALAEAFSKLYGYTSSEQGIRHALLDEGKANVTIDEALFFLGACASFASYLWRRHKAANTP